MSLRYPARNANCSHHDGVNTSAEFITGGQFSLDGVHPSNLGYAILANKFINAVNTKYGTAIMTVNLSEIKGHAPSKISADEDIYPDLKSLSKVVELFGGSLKQ